MTLQRKPPPSPQRYNPQSPISTRAYNRKDYEYISSFPLSTARPKYTSTEEELLQHKFHDTVQFSRLGYNTSGNSSIDSLGSNSIGSSNHDLHNVEMNLDSNNLSQMKLRLHSIEVDFDSDSLSQMKHQLHNTEVDFDSDSLSQMKHQLHNTEVDFDSDSLSQMKHQLHNTEVDFDSYCLSQTEHQLHNTEVGFDSDSLLQRQHKLRLELDPDSLLQMKNQLHNTRVESNINASKVPKLNADNLSQIRHKIWYNKKAEFRDTSNAPRIHHALHNTEVEFDTVNLEDVQYEGHQKEDMHVKASHNDESDKDETQCAPKDGAKHKVPDKSHALVPEFGTWDREMPNSSNEESYTNVFERAREKKLGRKLPKQFSVTHAQNLNEKGWTFPSQGASQIMKQRLTLADFLRHANSHRRKSSSSPWRFCFLSPMTFE